MGAIIQVNMMRSKAGRWCGGVGSPTFIIQMDYVETSDSATPAGNCDIRKVELDAPYQIKVSECLRNGGIRRV
jgi:hypothetical protein